MTDGFSMRRIYLNFETKERWRPNEPDFETKQILSQPFRYLSSGSQSFAFVSEDDKYVLKFFKIRPGYWKRSKPKRAESFGQAFDSCLIYQSKLQQESGLIYCHLSPSNLKFGQVTLIDAGKAMHKLEINQVPFVIQKRIETTKTRLLNCEEREKAIDSLFDLLVKRYQMGLSDKDPNLAENFGFIGDKAVSLDVGGLVSDKENLTDYFLSHELPDAGAKLNRFLKKHHPELSAYVDKKVADIISSSR